MLVKENKQLTSDIFALDLMGEFPFGKVMPGQFVNVLIGTGNEHPLRRPLSIASSDSCQEILTLVYRVVGDGTKWLGERKAGDTVNLLGPLGEGFPDPEKPGEVLLVGGGVGVPPLYQLARHLANKNFKLDIVLGFKDKSDIFWEKEFAEFGNVSICTEDGSKGTRGYVTEALLKDKEWTTLYSCGPKPMLKALKTYFAGKAIKGYVSLEERMACGVGACWGCTCLSQDGSETMRICKEGPVFCWEEVQL